MQRGWLTVLIALGDILVVNGGYLLAFYWRFGWPPPPRNFGPFLEMMPWLDLFLVLIFAGLGLYQLWRDGINNVLKSAALGALGVALLAMALSYWSRGFAFPRSVVLLGAMLQGVGLFAWRGVAWFLSRERFGHQKLLLIGKYEELSRITYKVLKLPGRWFLVQGALTPDQLGALKDQLPEVDAVLLLPSLEHPLKNQVLEQVARAGKALFIVPDFYDLQMTSSLFSRLDDLAVAEIPPLGLTWSQRFLKRVVDIVGALVGLVLFSPLFLISALAVKLSSPGPVFYVQERVGQGGKIFRLYKFRTMVVDAEKFTGPVLARSDDPRITPVGHLLRLIRLDELPQLINVLKGEMSLVGPRPERPYFVKRWSAVLPEYDYRLLVKPGLTGLAQVEGKYTTDPADKLSYDLYYIRHYSLLLDAQVILRTIPIIFTLARAEGEKEWTREEKALVHRIMNRSLSAVAATKDKGRNE